MSDPTSIWKKEIRLGGSREPDEGEQTSIWKKEIRLGGSREPDEGEQTSIWKKEIHLGRRSRLEQAVVEAMETASDTSSEPVVGKPSLWKKEFHLGSAPGDNPSFWKKDIRVLAPRKPSVPGGEVGPGHPLEPSREGAPEVHDEWAPPTREELGLGPEPSPESTIPLGPPSNKPAEPALEQVLAESLRERPGVTSESVPQGVAFEGSGELPVQPPAPFVPGLGVTLDEIDARLEAARAALAAVGARPASEGPEAGGTSEGQPALERLHVETLEEAEAGTLAARLSPKAGPAPTHEPEPTPQRDHDALEPPSDATAQLHQLFQPDRDAVGDDIDPRLHAAKAALVAVLAGGVAKSEASVVRTPQAAMPALERSQQSAEPALKSHARKLEHAPEQPPSFWRQELGHSASSMEKVDEAPTVPAERAPKQAAQPFWKKELSFGGGPKVKTAAAKKQSGSIWKKELGRGSKPKVTADEAAAVVVEPAPKPAAQPFWKKELSFGASSKVEPAAGTKQSFWKKELGRGAKSTVKVDQAPAEPALEQVLAESVRERPGVTSESVPQGVAFEGSGELPVQPPAPFVPGLGVTLDEIDARLEAARAALAAVGARPASEGPEAGGTSEGQPALERLHVETLEEEEAGTLAARLSPKAGPAPTHEPEPTPQRDHDVVAVGPSSFWKKELGRGGKSKVRVEELPAVALEHAPKQAAQPFWKKELSFGGGSKVKTPVVEKQPGSFWKKEIGGKAKSHRAAVAAAAPDLERAPKPAAQPFWKKELGRGSKSQPPDVALVASELERAPKPAAQPFWKKELSFGGGSKVKTAAPRKQSGPFWKKELGRGAKSKVKVETPAVAAQRTPKPAAQPFWKKELSFGGGSKVKTASAKRQSAPKRKGVTGSSHIGEGSVPSLANVVGLRIGSSQLVAALVHNNGSAELLQLASEALEPGIVAVGEVRDAPALAQALKRFFAKNKLPRSGVRLGVATNRIGVRVLEVPVMDDPKLLENAIRFRAQEVLPFPLADAVLDHVLLGKTTSPGDGEQQRVLLVFAHRELVDGYLDACRRAGLKLAGIDFEAFALLRALAAKSDEPTEKNVALVAVAIGRERTIFAVSDGATCDFARVLEWGGVSLDTALASALKISPDDAERLKRSLSLDGDDAIGALSATEAEAARAALREELQVLARELVSSLQFYQSRPESLDIGEVLLTGGGAQLDGIEAELARQLGVPIRRADPLGRVTCGDSVIAPADTGSVAIAVGLGIES